MSQPHRTQSIALFPAFILITIISLNIYPHLSQREEGTQTIVSVPHLFNHKHESRKPFSPQKPIKGFPSPPAPHSGFFCIEIFTNTLPTLFLISYPSIPLFLGSRRRKEGLCSRALPLNPSFLARRTKRIAFKNPPALSPSFPHPLSFFLTKFFFSLARKFSCIRIFYHGFQVLSFSPRKKPSLCLILFFSLLNCLLCVYIYNL